MVEIIGDQVIKLMVIEGYFVFKVIVKLDGLLDYCVVNVKVELGLCIIIDIVVFDFIGVIM